jgi:hypothetical protein
MPGATTIISAPPPPPSYLRIQGPIVPGQPIVISWEIADASIPGKSNLASPLSSWGNVVATVTFNGNVLYQSQAIKPSKATSTKPFVAEVSGYSAGEQDVTIKVAGSQSFATALYTVGTHTLTLTIKGDAPPPLKQFPNMYTATATALLTVVFERVDSSWWNWTSPDPGQVIATAEWNNPYEMAGAFTNKSKWSTMKVQYTLWETDQTDNLPPVVRGSGSLTANVGSTVPAAFNAITQNWGWLACPSGVQIHTFQKIFNYVVTMTLQDNWGNNYAPVNSTTLPVIVSVSETKYNESTGAVVAAAAATSSSWWCPLCGAIAAGVAAGLCAAANDPPAPDPNYLVTAKVVVPETPWTADANAGKTATLAFFSLALRYTATADALSRTEGKLIGANAGNNEEGIRLQTSAFREIQNEIMAVAKQLPEAASAAVDEIEAEPSASQENVNTRLRMWQVYGVPRSVEQAWSDANVSQSTISMLRGNIKSANPDTLPPLTNSVINLTHVLLIDAQHLKEKTV